MSQRLLMLGLDGVGTVVFDRLARDGVLPNLSMLGRSGTYGALIATVPPITGPSWLGVSTGLDVDQTGIADFLVRRPPLYELRPIGSRDFRGRAVWDLVGAAGFRTCVFNFPILYPPYDANGIMVSGFGSDESTQWTSPASVKEELIEVVGRDYNLAVNYHAEHYDDVGLFLDDLEASFDRRVRAAEWLLQREPWDLAVCVFSETDWLMHRCWDLLDTSGEPLSGDRHALSDRVRDVFARLDAAIPRLLGAMGTGTSLLVCSDHGFGPNTCTFKINAALEKAGLLVRRGASTQRSARLHRAGVRIAQRAGAAAARVRGPVGRTLARVRRRTRRFLPKDDSAFLSAVIDSESSAVLDPGHTIPFAGLYTGTRIERGTARYDAALGSVDELLAEASAGAGIPMSAIRPWQLAGGLIDTLPDVLVSGDDWGMTFSKTDFDGPLLVPGPFSRRHTGSHRLDGIFVASGPLFGHAPAGEKASVLDIAPTVLAAFGLAAPADRRGRVLPAFRGSVDGLVTASTVDSADGPEPSEDDDDDVRERLRGLGYIE